MILLGFHCTSYLPNTALIQTSYSGRGWNKLMLCTGRISSVGLLDFILFIDVFIDIYLFCCVLVSRLCYQCPLKRTHGAYRIIHSVDDHVRMERTGSSILKTINKQEQTKYHLITSWIPLISLIRVSTSSMESSVINPCSRQLDKFI